MLCCSDEILALYNFLELDVKQAFLDHVIFSRSLDLFLSPRIRFGGERDDMANFIPS